MNKIQVGVIAEHGAATEMMCFLARLTQRGHSITSLEDINELMGKPASPELAKAMIKMERHGTIKRFTPITVAIVGASRRFLAQARTNQVGFNYVSASLQYSDYGGTADFVVPYALLEADIPTRNYYLSSCKNSMDIYSKLVSLGCDNDTAGYASPQGLRNILIMQGNHEAWRHFIALRSCNRNTVETQYVTLRIWEELLKTEGGEEMFAFAGPDCMYGRCREGKMCCGEPLKRFTDTQILSIPRRIIFDKWPLLGRCE